MDSKKNEEEYYWDSKVTYLKDSRRYMWNDDYMMFLINYVWRINEPVNIIDFGCGLGYVGSLMMPLLPKGSTYTGVDMGEKLIEEAREIFDKSSFETEFMVDDIFTFIPRKKYDIAICQALLMHLPNPKEALKKMIDTVIQGGRIICIELNWNLSNASLYLNNISIDDVFDYGILAKLWSNEIKRYNTDKSIGNKLPVNMAELGLANIGVRVNDSALFVNPYSDEHEKQLKCFLSDWYHKLGDKTSIIESLYIRGLSKEEANTQYENELHLHQYIKDNHEELLAVHAALFFITYGTVLIN
jgi:2-polyprenyl-3-methyl-5-hydroxy-6-metoxy-1,4-benzoquinol methylase